MEQRFRWYRATITATLDRLPPAWIPGEPVSINIQGNTVRVMHAGYPIYLDVEEAKQTLRTERDEQGRPVPDPRGADFDHQWSRWFNC